MLCAYVQKDFPCKAFFHQLGTSPECQYAHAKGLRRQCRRDQTEAPVQAISVFAHALKHAAVEQNLAAVFKCNQVLEPVTVCAAP
jgi:hypothetical protein